MGQDYYLLIGSQTSGPFPLAEVERMLNAGQITAQTLFCVPGAKDWYPVAQLMQASAPPKLNVKLPKVGKLAPCKACGSMVSRGARACPQCGQKLGTTLLRNVVGLLVLFLILAAINQAMNEEAQKSGKVLKVEDFKFMETDRGNYVEGTLRNNTDYEYRGVEVRFNCYDGTGAMLGTAWDIVDNLEAGNVWKFKANVHDKNAETVRLKEINGRPRY